MVKKVTGLLALSGPALAGLAHHKQPTVSKESCHYLA